MLKIQSIHINIVLTLQSKTGVSVCSFQCHLFPVSHALRYDALESVGYTSRGSYSKVLVLFPSQVGSIHNFRKELISGRTIFFLLRVYPF